MDAGGAGNTAILLQYSAVTTTETCCKIRCGYRLRGLPCWVPVSKVAILVGCRIQACLFRSDGHMTLYIAVLIGCSNRLIRVLLNSIFSCDFRSDGHMTLYIA